jgi:hypothetical protein
MPKQHIKKCFSNHICLEYVSNHDGFFFFFCRVNEFGFSAEMLNEKDQPAAAAINADPAVVPTINGQPVTVREVDTGPATDSEDAAEAAKTGAWKAQKQKSKKAKKID